MRIHRCFLLLALIGVTGAEAAKLVEHAGLPTVEALKAAQAALRSCRQQGYAVSVAVVDAGGNLQVLLRDEDAGPHTVHSSRRKAYTALSLRKPTHELAQLLARKPQVQGLRDMSEDILILGGGLPVKAGNRVVGGIGVGGAPGAMLDVACARAGLRAIGYP